VSVGPGRVGVKVKVGMGGEMQPVKLVELCKGLGLAVEAGEGGWPTGGLLPRGWRQV